MCGDKFCAPLPNLTGYYFLGTGLVQRYSVADLFLILKSGFIASNELKSERKDCGFIHVKMKYVFLPKNKLFVEAVSSSGVVKCQN